MTWKTLADALETAIAKGFDVDGDAGIAVPAVSRKNAQSAKLRASATEPRQAGGENLNGASKTHMRPALRLVSSRDIGRASPYELPRSARPISLVLVCSDGHVGQVLPQQAKDVVRRWVLLHATTCPVAAASRYL